MSYNFEYHDQHSLLSTEIYKVKFSKLDASEDSFQPALNEIREGHLISTDSITEGTVAPSSSISNRNMPNLHAVTYASHGGSDDR
jgi:hypothetical protein